MRKQQPKQRYTVIFEGHKVKKRTLKELAKWARKNNVKVNRLEIKVE